MKSLKQTIIHGTYIDIGISYLILVIGKSANINIILWPAIVSIMLGCMIIFCDAASIWIKLEKRNWRLRK